MDLTDNKLKIFTKQIYNHILDEYGDDFSFTPQNVFDKIQFRTDEIIDIFTNKMDIDTKRAISFMISLYSENKNLDEIVKFVKDNYTYMDIIHWTNFNTKTIDCNECGGSGGETCERCDGYEYVECDTCDGEERITCDYCDGSGYGTTDEETCDECDGRGDLVCYDCGGDGKVDCGNCEGTGTSECSECNTSGEMESSDKYFDKYSGFICSISPDISNLPTDTILTEEQVILLLETQSIKKLDLEDNMVDEYEPMSYKGDGDGVDHWLIEYSASGF